MAFRPDQNQNLAAPLSSANVKGRKQGGRQVSYIEGWHAIAEANRIFGFDGWTRETLDLRAVAQAERTIGAGEGKPGYPGWGVSYIARVRVVAFAGDSLVIREGAGAGHGIDRDLGQAHESALKEAETDAMKRALMTFGNPFGLALYDKQQTNVVSEEEASKLQFIAECQDRIATFVDPAGLMTWWSSAEQKKARRDFGLSQDEVDALKTAVTSRRDAMPKPELSNVAAG